MYVGEHAHLGQQLALAPGEQVAEWSSSDPGVATVADGVVTARGIGTATVTASTSRGRRLTQDLAVEPETVAGETPVLDLAALLAARLGATGGLLTASGGEPGLGTLAGGRLSFTGRPGWCRITLGNDRSGHFTFTILKQPAGPVTLTAGQNRPLGELVVTPPANLGGWTTTTDAVRLAGNKVTGQRPGIYPLALRIVTPFGLVLNVPIEVIAASPRPSHRSGRGLATLAATALLAAAGYWGWQKYRPPGEPAAELALSVPGVSQSAAVVEHPTPAVSQPALANPVLDATVSDRSVAAPARSEAVAVVQPAPPPEPAPAPPAQAPAPAPARRVEVLTAGLMGEVGNSRLAGDAVQFSYPSLNSWCGAWLAIAPRRPRRISFTVTGDRLPPWLKIELKYEDGEWKQVLYSAEVKLDRPGTHQFDIPELMEPVNVIALIIEGWRYGSDGNEFRVSNLKMSEG